MAVTGFLRKRLFIKIVLGVIVFFIFLSGIINITSTPIYTFSVVSTSHSVYTRSQSANRTIQNISYTRLQHESTLSNVRHTCDIPVSRNKNDPALDLAHRFPHIIIIGFGKAGTRALYQMIRMHPDVVGPSSELRFFSNDLKYTQGLDSYVRLMPATISRTRTIEKSPDYIIKAVAAQRLKKALDLCDRTNEIKFIVVLREPFRRAVSEYVQWKTTLKLKGKSLEDFEKLAIRKSGVVNNLRSQVNSSIYSYHLRNWLKIFDKKKMCFVDGDHLVKEPYTVVKRLEKCLELRDFITRKHFYYNERKRYYCPVDSKGNPHCLGSDKGRLHPEIDKDVELMLKQFFQPYNKELYEMTGINFGWT